MPRRCSPETLSRLRLGHWLGRSSRPRSGWPEDDETDNRYFLSAFYKAQRARLEHKMLFGVRQEEKKKGRLAQEPGTAGNQEKE